MRREARSLRPAECDDDDFPFALQSVSKVFAYGLALEDHGRAHVLQRVGVKPSGDAFNSIGFDERHNRPLQPDGQRRCARDQQSRARRRLRREARTDPRQLREYAGSERLEVDEHTSRQELRAADHNRAMAYLMRSQGMIDGDVEATLALYLGQCAVTVNCRELALMGATLANGGTNPATGRGCLPRDRVRDVLSVMRLSPRGRSRPPSSLAR